jgi:hypothetical protein
MTSSRRSAFQRAIAAGWIPPERWSVPREWVGERCFIICGGESVKAQRKLIPQLKGRIIAVKQSVLLRPDADLLWFGGESMIELMTPLVPNFKGTYMAVRGKSCPGLPDSVKRVGRQKDHTTLSTDPTLVCGYDTGTSAINLAYHFGVSEVILLGYDMTGGRWFNGEIAHPMPVIPESHFSGHMAPLPKLAQDCKAKGLRVVNCSPISRVTCFEKQPLEAFL